METLTKPEFNLLYWMGSGFLRVWRDGGTYCWLCIGGGVAVPVLTSARAISELLRKKMIERQDAVISAELRERGMEAYIKTARGRSALTRPCKASATLSRGARARELQST